MGEARRGLHAVAWTLALMALVMVLAASQQAWADGGGLAAASGDAQQAQAPNPLQTQAAKKKVYVITSVKSTNKLSGRKLTSTEKFSYNDSGLVSKCVGVGFAAGNGAVTTTWAYDGKGRVASAEQDSSSISRKVAFKVNKNGAIAKSTSIEENAYTHSQRKTVATYKAKSGVVRSATVVTYSKANGKWKKSGSYKESYSYKGGRVASFKSGQAQYGYSYDSKGNIAKRSAVVMGQKGVATVKNAYDPESGTLAKRVVKESLNGGPASQITTTYKYKLVKVSTSMAAQVKAQQWAIINENTNFAFGGLLGSLT